METTENTQIEAVSEGLLEQDHQAKRHKVLTQNVHLAPSTQQAEQAGFTRAKSHETCQSIFPEN
jgi:hypothetical protein